MLFKYFRQLVITLIAFKVGALNFQDMIDYVDIHKDNTFEMYIKRHKLLNPASSFNFCIFDDGDIRRECILNYKGNRIFEITFNQDVYSSADLNPVSKPVSIDIKITEGKVMEVQIIKIHNTDLYRQDIHMLTLYHKDEIQMFLEVKPSHLNGEIGSRPTHMVQIHAPYLTKSSSIITTIIPIKMTNNRYDTLVTNFTNFKEIFGNLIPKVSFDKIQQIYKIIFTQLYIDKDCCLFRVYKILDLLYAQNKTADNLPYIIQFTAHDSPLLFRSNSDIHSSYHVTLIYQDNITNHFFILDPLFKFKPNTPNNNIPTVEEWNTAIHVSSINIKTMMIYKPVWHETDKFS